MPRSLLSATPLLFVLLWSTGFIGSKLGAPYAPPMMFLTLRFLIVLPLIAMIALAMKGRWPKSKAMIFHCIVIGALIHGVYLGCVFWAIDNGMPAGMSAVVVGLQPVISALFAALLLRESIGMRHVSGLLLGLVGVFLVLAPGADFSQPGVQVATIAAVALAVTAISFGTVYQKRFVHETDLLPATTWQYVGAVLVTLPLTFLETRSVEWSGEFIFALGWLVLVLSIGAILLLMFLIRKGAVSEVASLFYLVPVATSIESYFLFGETLVLSQISGMILVALAVVLIRRKARV
ncbi:DMT family transporter [Roseibium sp.]|uniref:DMT family transporter n=1 Tax=Roseibium sp. TaxID=1936156 RepID=UPI003A96BFAE